MLKLWSFICRKSLQSVGCYGRFDTDSRAFHSPLWKIFCKTFAEIDILKIVLELLLFVLSCRDQQSGTNNVCCLNTECAQLNRGLVRGIIDCLGIIALQHTYQNPALFILN